jgi:superfamily I DNA and/or RNA helicase
VEVQTVHRSQGSERRSIFFDPVFGSHRAVSDRLVNVALSRAQRHLTIAFSRGDLLNPRLARIHDLCARSIQNNVLS